MEKKNSRTCCRKKKVEEERKKTTVKTKARNSKSKRIAQMPTNYLIYIVFSPLCPFMHFSRLASSVWPILGKNPFGEKKKKRKDEFISCKRILSVHFFFWKTCVALKISLTIAVSMKKCINKWPRRNLTEMSRLVLINVFIKLQHMVSPYTAKGEISHYFVKAIYLSLILRGN